MTVSEIIEEMESDQDCNISIVKITVGKSVDDVVTNLHMGSIRIIDKETIASDYRRVRNGDDVILIITVDDSTDKEDPNVKRYMAKDLTYNQAKVMHLRGLGYGQVEIAEREGTTRVAVQKREDLAAKKLGGTILYERR